MSNFELNYSVRTHQGCVRSNNEDNYYVNGVYRKDININQQQFNGSADAKMFLGSVCDGMGGEENGELASLEAVKALKPSSWSDITATATESIKVANDAVCNLIRQNEGKRSGSTFAGLYIDEDKAISCNLGDSPIYIYRDGAFTKISTDHSMAARMVASGLMTEEEVRTWKGRHQITQYIGIFEEEMILSPAYSQPFELKDNDMFLICSDGLTDMMTDEQIKAILDESTDDLQKTVDALVEGALAAGGKDNVTIVLVKAKRKAAVATPVASVAVPAPAPATVAASSAPAPKKNNNKTLIYVIAIILVLVAAFVIGFAIASHTDKSSKSKTTKVYQDHEDEYDNDDDESSADETEIKPGHGADTTAPSVSEEPEESTDTTIGDSQHESEGTDTTQVEPTPTHSVEPTPTPTRPPRPGSSQDNDSNGNSVGNTDNTEDDEFVDVSINDIGDVIGDIIGWDWLDMNTDDYYYDACGVWVVIDIEL